MITINLLGPTVVTNGGRTIHSNDLGGVKPRQILQMLALELGTPLSKDLLADRLWEGQPPSSYIATVESYVCVLRNRAGLGHGRRAPLATTTCGYLLDPEQVSVDVTQVRSLLATDSVSDVLRALDLASSDLLAEEPYASWARQEREALAEQLIGACVRAARLANQEQDWASATRLARAAYGRSYLSEAAACELMTALAGSGERWQALQVYEQLRNGMLEELGVEPSGSTTQLYLTTLRSGTTVGTGTARPEEVGTLLRLLRRALEGTTELLEEGTEMAEVGRLLLARCG